MRYFSSVPDLLMNEFLKESQNPIYLVEMLACYIAIRLWGPNAVGRYALIKGYSSTNLGNVIVKLVVSSEDDFQWKIWYGRVPTAANTSDAPSRLECEELDRLRVPRDEIAWDEVILSFQHQQHDVVG